MQLTCLKDNKILKIENILKQINDIFYEACIPGPWTEAKGLDIKLSKFKGI